MVPAIQLGEMEIDIVTAEQLSPSPLHRYRARAGYQFIPTFTNQGWSGDPGEGHPAVH